MSASPSLTAAARCLSSPMDGGRIGSIQIALTKAVSAATRRRPTAASDNTVTNMGGGLPLNVDGQVIGAIGVRSGTVDQDVAVAQAGLAALA